MEFIKKASAPDEAVDRSIRQRVEAMLKAIEAGGEASALQWAEQLDGWTGDVVLSDEKRAALIDQVLIQRREDIQFAHA